MNAFSTYGFAFARIFGEQVIGVAAVGFGIAHRNHLRDARIVRRRRPDAEVGAERAGDLVAEVRADAAGRSRGARLRRRASRSVSAW